MIDLYIVRHGNTFDKGDIVRRVGARTDLPLSVSGRWQAAALGKYFQEILKNISKSVSKGASGARSSQFDHIYVSPLRRTQETAHIISEHIALDSPIALDSSDVSVSPRYKILDWLCEIDYGPDEGQPEADVRARIGEAALHAWEQSAVVPAGWQVDVAQSIAAWSDFANTLVETHGKQKDRVAILIVTSAGVARFAADLVDKAQRPASLKLATGALSHLQYNVGAAAWQLRTWNQRPTQPTI